MQVLGPHFDEPSTGSMMNRMQMRLLTRAAVAFVLGLAPVALANSGGGPPFTSGGAFPGERVCTLCHQGSEANSGSGKLEVLIGEPPASDYMYIPGETATLLVGFSDKDAVRIGFQLTVRSGDGCGQPGALAASSSAAGSRVKIGDGDCGGTASQVQWATHRRPQTGSEAEFEVAWTAPEESVGPVTVAVAVNSANGDLSPRGDRIYTKQITIQPFSAPSTPPAISEGGVILADLFSRTATGAPNAIATVQGENFAAAGTASDASLDDTGRVATVLDGVCVEVNQQESPVFHLFPDQVNFQIPSDAGTGAAIVQVVRGCGTADEERSNRAPFQIAALQPVFFLFSENPPAAALHLDSSLVAAADSLPGRISRPAVPGDIVTLFGTGFGPVIPPLASGELALQPRELGATSVRPMIGQVELEASDIVYAGAAASFAGLYQVSVRIPDTVGAGTHEFSVMVDGVQSAKGPKLAIDVPEPGPPVCATDLSVVPGASCVTVIGRISITFSVDETGKACVSMPSLGLYVCGEDTLDLSLYGVSVRKNADGSWTIARLP